MANDRREREIFWWTVRDLGSQSRQLWWFDTWAGTCWTLDSCCTLSNSITNLQIWELSPKKQIEGWYWNKPRLITLHSFFLIDGVRYHYVLHHQMVCVVWLYSILWALQANKAVVEQQWCGALIGQVAAQYPDETAGVLLFIPAFWLAAITLFLRAPTWFIIALHFHAAIFNSVACTLLYC